MKLSRIKRIKQDSLNFSVFSISLSAVLAITAMLVWPDYSGKNNESSSNKLTILLAVLMTAVTLIVLIPLITKTKTALNKWANKQKHLVWYNWVRHTLPIILLTSLFYAYKHWFNYPIKSADFICVIWLLACQFTPILINDTVKFFSMRAFSLNCIYGMLIYIVIDVICNVVSVLPSGNSACQQADRKVSELESMIKSVMIFDKAYLCTAIPNIISGTLVTLLGVGLVLYPIIQKLPEKREQWIKQITLVNSLTKSKNGVPPTFQNAGSVQLHKLALLGSWFLPLLGVSAYASTAFGLESSLKILSLIIVYTFYTAGLIMEAHLSKPLLSESSSLKQAVSVVLRKKVNAQSIVHVTLTPSNLDEFTSISGYLNEHLLTTKNYVVSVGYVPDFPILLEIDYRIEEKEIKVTPLTTEFELPQALMSEFKPLLAHKLNALHHNLHSNKKELQVWFRAAVYEDVFTLVSKYYEEDNYRKAVTAFLTICADSITDFLPSNWIDIAESIPEESATVKNLLIYLDVNKSTWPTIENIEVDGLDSLYTCPVQNSTSTSNSALKSESEPKMGE